MGLVITPLETPRKFDPLGQPLATSQKLGGRELVWRFDGGDITSDGGVLALKKLELLSFGFFECFICDHTLPKPQATTVLSPFNDDH